VGGSKAAITTCPVAGRRARTTLPMTGRSSTTGLSGGPAGLLDTAVATFGDAVALAAAWFAYQALRL